MNNKKILKIIEKVLDDNEINKWELFCPDNIDIAKEIIKKIEERFNIVDNRIHICLLTAEGKLCWSNFQGYFLRNDKYPDEDDIFLSQLFENYHNLVGEKIKIIVELKN